MNQLLKVIAKRHRAAPWNPEQLPGLRGHWVPGMLGLPEGSRVMTLPSLGGISNTLTALDEDRAPIYSSAMGPGAITLDGSGDTMMMADNTVSNGAVALTYFLLLRLERIPTSSTTGIMMGVGISTVVAGTGRYILCFRNTPGELKPWTVYIRDADNTTTLSASSTVNADLDAHVVVASCNREPAGNVRTEIWLDGVNILTDDKAFVNPTWPATDSVNSYVGSRDGTGNSIVGGIMNCGIIRGVPSTPDREKLEAYLAWYGGIQGQLPPAHPYFAAPP